MNALYTFLTGCIAIGVAIVIRTMTSGANSKPHSRGEPGVSTASAKLNCLCGAVSELGSIITAETFPLEAALCVCDSCRYTSGTLGSIFIDLRQGPSKASLAACSSTKTGPVDLRYFCSTCGTKVFMRYGLPNGKTGWAAFSGIVDRTDVLLDVDVVKLTSAEFVSDTRDGGIVSRMANVIYGMGFIDMRFKIYSKDDCKWNIRPDELGNLYKRFNDDAEAIRVRQKVLISCRCKKNQLYMLPPSPTMNDLNAQQVTRWLREKNTKYLAKFCSCRSCRLGMGAPLASWTYVMPENLSTVDGRAVEFDFEHGFTNFPDLKNYRSSNAVWRSFCKSCGATFLSQRENRPYVFNVPLGLIRAESGSLAEEWVDYDWYDVSWHQECRDRGLLQIVTGDDEYAIPRIGH